MSSEEGKSKGATTGGASVAQHPLPPSQYYYGTFQGVANHQPPPLSHPSIGLPQPMPPPGSSGYSPHYYPHGYQTVPGYAVSEGRTMREHRLPCCGLGIGWLLFIIGFFFGAIPWYIGAFILLCVHVDYREKAGLIACTIAAILAIIAVTVGVTKANHSW